MPRLSPPPAIDSFEKAAFPDTIFWSNIFTSEIIFVKNLNKMTTRDMLFKVKECPPVHVPGFFEKLQ